MTVFLSGEENVALRSYYFNKIFLWKNKKILKKASKKNEYATMKREHLQIKESVEEKDNE